MKFDNLIIAALIIINLILLYFFAADKRAQKNPDYLSSTYDYKYIAFKDSSDYKSDFKFSGFKLLVFIYEAGCISCNQKTVQFLNDFYPKYSRYCNIYLIGSSSDYLSKFHPQFIFRKTDFIPSVLTENNLDLYPVLLLVDKNGVIQKVHTVSFRDYNRTKIFLFSISSFLDSLG